MKTANDLIQDAKSIGIFLWVEGGQLRYKARQPIADDFKAQIKKHRAEIIHQLTVQPILPNWCAAKCDHFHEMKIPGMEPVRYCCLETDSKNWLRIRIENLNECPAGERTCTNAK